MKSAQSRKRGQRSGLVKFVDARAVWKFLDVDEDFESWIMDRITTYGFVKGDDYIICVTISSAPFTGMLDGMYVISCDMALELAMLEHTPRAREIRRLCIDRIKRTKAPRRSAR